ncbi:unnamed protein product [Euphydryas editha]|uniref:Uncharacterized protein n=1 Tax=Euphydryas editha TaxID=104508 RepID=A0AAU9TGA1_EUPED|nr:unnamed protein product [Euphydryas editha]
MSNIYTVYINISHNMRSNWQEEAQEAVTMTTVTIVPKNSTKLNKSLLQIYRRSVTSPRATLFRNLHPEQNSSTERQRRTDQSKFQNKNSAVTDPRDGRRVALKKLPNVFQSLVSSKRVFRELKMLCFFKHENVSKVKILIKI